jgi:DHA3 family macrolide efflux protein-like MFS transporter
VKLVGMKTFFVVWFGQFISVIGSSLTSFALGIWVLKETGSISKFSMILLCASLPNILLSMFAGVIVDRFKRKWIMMISDGVAGLASLVLFTLLYTKSLEIWHIYIIVAITSIFSSLQMPAYQSSVSLLVPKEQLGRANGLMQLADASSIVIAPILAGFLLHLFGIYSVVLIDFLSFFVAISTMLMVKLPELDLNNKEKLNTASFLREAKAGWTYIKERKGLKWLLINFAIANFLLGFFNVLLQPLILTLSNERVLGVVISMTGIGMLAGSILMSSWGGPKNKIKGLFGFGTMIGVCIGIAGTSESLVLITIALSLSLFCLPISNACSRVIWQSKVDPKLQGRVFSLRSMVSTSLSPIAIVLAGPVAENIFSPLMAKDGLLAQSVGAVIGAGAGRGIGLLFICIGFIYLVSSIMIYLHPRVRQLENELPDANEKVRIKDVTV